MIIDIVNRTRDVRPDDAIIIIDESVYFLDILDVAFKKMYEPVRRFRYDGRMNQVERHLTLKEFSSCTSTWIILASHGTGRQALKIQTDNVLIRCGA